MVINVDLECERFNRKITSVLQKIQDKMNIKMAILFDEKKNEVTISGPFDAEKVRRKLCCKADRIIKDMKEVEAPEVKKGGGMEKEEDGGKTAAAPAVNVDLGPLLLAKMLPLERPKAKPQPATCTCCCGCTCGKQTTKPSAQGHGVPVPAKSVSPAPASSVSGDGCDYEAPPYYGVPVYSIEGWY